MRFYVCFLFSALLGLHAACGGVVPEATCTSNDECFDNYVCASAETGSSEKICLRSCTADTDCLNSQLCDTSVFACRMDETSGSDDASGDS